MQRMAGAMASTVHVDGHPTSMLEVLDQYGRGDHLIDGGPEVGLFWASSITSLEAANGAFRRPVEHAFRAIRQAGPGESSR